MNGKKANPPNSDQRNKPQSYNKTFHGSSSLAQLMIDEITLPWFFSILSITQRTT